MILEARRSYRERRARYFRTLGDALAAQEQWPASRKEYRRALGIEFIPGLTDPERFGADPADAFTIVAPSLPGYGLSFTPGQERFGIEAIADCFAALMSDAL